MAIPDNQKLTLQVLVSGTIAAKGAGIRRTFNTLHFRRTTPGVASDKAAFITAFVANIGNLFDAALNLTWTHDSDSCRFLEDATDPFLDVANGGVGAITGDRMPPDNTAYILLRTNLRGPRYRGSLHLSPFSESDTDAATADLFNAAAQGRIQAIGDSLLAPFADASGNNWVPTIVSRYNSNFAVVPAVIGFADIATAIARKSIGRLKRRTPEYTY